MVYCKLLIASKYLETLDKIFIAILLKIAIHSCLKFHSLQHVVYKTDHLLKYCCCIADETAAENALDTRVRGIGKSKRGSLIWNIPKDLQFRSSKLHSIQYSHHLKDIYRGG